MQGDARDHLAFEAAREQNTAAAYQDFIDRFPDAAQIYQARSRLQEAIYREVDGAGDRGGFRSVHPRAPGKPLPEERRGRDLPAGHRAADAEAYHGFITNYPLNHRVPDAWRKLYELYTKDLNTANITRFLKDYPDYPFIQELSADYSTAALVLHPFRRDSLWGFIDEEGIERIKAEFDWVDEFHGGQTLVGRDGRVGSINKAGHVVIGIDHDDVQEFSEGLATVERAGHVGVVDRLGELVVPMEFEEIGEFSGGLAYAMRDGRYGYIDAGGSDRDRLRV